MVNRKQLSIPGLDNCLPIEKPLVKNDRPRRQNQIADLQDRVLALELEVTLLHLQLDNGRAEDT